MTLKPDLKYTTKKVLITAGKNAFIHFFFKRLSTETYAYLDKEALICRGNTGLTEQKYKGMMDHCSRNTLGLAVFMCTSYGESYKSFRNFY